MVDGSSPDSLLKCRLLNVSYSEYCLALDTGIEPIEAAKVFSEEQGKYKLVPASSCTTSRRIWRCAENRCLWEGFSFLKFSQHQVKVHGLSMSNQKARNEWICGISDCVDFSPRSFPKFVKHLKNVHGILNSELVEDSSITQWSIWICPVPNCLQTFALREDCESHALRIHSYKKLENGKITKQKRVSSVFLDESYDSEVRDVDKASKTISQSSATVNLAYDKSKQKWLCRWPSCGFSEAKKQQFEEHCKQVHMSPFLKILDSSCTATCYFPGCSEELSHLELRNHIWHIHCGIGKVFECAICSTYFLTSTALTLHKTSTHFPRISELISKYIHVEEDISFPACFDREMLVYRCRWPECRRFFRNYTAYTEHISSDHISSYQRPRSRNRKSNPEMSSTISKCPLCSESVVRIFHETLFPSIFIICLLFFFILEQTFLLEHLLRVHLDGMLGRRCRICKKSLVSPNKDKYLKHLLSLHTEEIYLLARAKESSSLLHS